MKRIIALSGMCGSGKTHRRTHDPELKDLPYVDIADVYKENPDISHGDAFSAMLERMHSLLLKNDVVVIEASLRSEWQLDYVDSYAHRWGVHVHYIKMRASKKVLLQRVEHDYQESKKIEDPVKRDAEERYYNARVSYIEASTLR